MTFIQTATLEFGFSPSPMYRRALQLAERLPGHEATGIGRQRRDRVPIDTTDGKPADLVELCYLVAGWKSARVLHERDNLGSVAVYRLGSVLECHRRYQRAEAGELYCWGWPGGSQRVGCRMLDQQLPWSLHGIYADPKRAELVVRGAAQEALLGLCPVFSLDDASTELAARARQVEAATSPPPAAPDWLVGLLRELPSIDDLTDRGGGDEENHHDDID